MEGGEQEQQKTVNILLMRQGPGADSDRGRDNLSDIDADNDIEEDLPVIHLRGFNSVDYASLREQKAKRSLLEMGQEQQNPLTSHLNTPIARKDRIARINAWGNLELNQSVDLCKLRGNQFTIPIHKNEEVPSTSKGTNIPYLKHLLEKLESPSHKKSVSACRRGFYYGSLPDSSKNSYRSARVPGAIRVKENWTNCQDLHPRPSYEPFTSASCRLNRPESKSSKSRITVPNPNLNLNTNSKNVLDGIRESELIRLILLKKKETLMKKKKVSPAKVLNLKAKVKILPTSRPQSREHFNLLQLLH